MPPRDTYETSPALIAAVNRLKEQIRQALKDNK